MSTALAGPHGSFCWTGIKELGPLKNGSNSLYLHYRTAGRYTVRTIQESPLVPRRRLVTSVRQQVVPGLYRLVVSVLVHGLFGRMCRADVLTVEALAAMIEVCLRWFDAAKRPMVRPSVIEILPSCPEGGHCGMHLPLLKPGALQTVRRSNSMGNVTFRRSLGEGKKLSDAY